MRTNNSNILSNAGKAISSAMQSVGTYTGQAAARANGVSFASQAAQGQFNQASADIANGLADSRLFDQYAYNSAQAAEANNFTQQMWNQAAAYNNQMFEREMAFNSEQAQKNREFQLAMDQTKYQRAVKDMSKAGLNPILAVTGGGISASSPSGSTASVSAPSMGGASGQMASGGLLNGISASEGNFSGQMEYMSGILGLISTAFAGISSAMGAMSGLGSSGLGIGIAEGLGEALSSAIGKNIEKATGGKGLYDKIKESNPKTSIGNWFKEDQKKAKERMDRYYRK